MNTKALKESLKAEEQENDELEGLGLRGCGFPQPSQQHLVRREAKPRVTIYKGYSIWFNTTTGNWWVSDLQGKIVDWCKDKEDGMRVIDRKLETSAGGRIPSPAEIQTVRNRLETVYGPDAVIVVDGQPAVVLGPHMD